MALFRRNDTAPIPSANALAAGRMELNRGGGTGFGDWLDRVSAGGPAGMSGWGAREMRAYRALRAGVPIVDAAVSRLVRLCGGFALSTGSEELDAALTAWSRALPTGYGGRGVDGLLDAYLDSLLVCGRAAAELVTDESGAVIGAVCLDPAELSPLKSSNPLDFRLRRLGGGAIDPARLLFTPFAPEPGAPYGVSLLRSLGGACEKLTTILDAIGRSWERFGSPHYAVTVKDADSLFGDEERLEKIAEQWTRVMTSAPGENCDFVAAGDLDVRVIGADGQEMDPTAPARLICEQIVAKLGIPPFLLGLSWSSTERMSTQQADLLTSEIEAIRRTVTPALEKLYSTQLAAMGESRKAEIVWSNVSLQDEVELARAELYRMQAKEIAADLK